MPDTPDGFVPLTDEQVEELRTQYLIARGFGRIVLRQIAAKGGDMTEAGRLFRMVVEGDKILERAPWDLDSRLWQDYFGEDAERIGRGLPLRDIDVDEFERDVRRRDRPSLPSCSLSEAVGMALNDVLKKLGKLKTDGDDAHKTE